ncbi:MAG: flagellar brake protein [Gammaproteobacteria bacterium]|nr:flagellar brake protein [Gammaproteobacteria bacterium]
MSAPSHNPLLDLTALPDREKYLLTSRAAVITALNDLNRKPELITAYYDHGDKSIITTIVKVLPERDLVLLERSPSARNNEQLLAGGNTTCLGRHHDINIRFQLHDLRDARYQGEQVFAAPIPDSLLRLQRREFFRVHVPLMNPITCRFSDSDGEELLLPLADLSLGGLGMTDTDRRFTGEVGMRLESGILTFPDNDELMEVTLQVRGIFTQGDHQTPPIQRIGCAYTDLSTERLNFLQRYIHQLQILQKNLTRD